MQEVIGVSFNSSEQRFIKLLSNVSESLSRHISSGQRGVMRLGIDGVIENSVECTS